MHALRVHQSMFWLQQSATYACHVQSGAGSSTARVEVTVTTPEVTPLCRGESLLGVQWPHTAPGQVAMQPCPAQQRWSNRAARRMCTTYDIKVVRWETPDYAECVSAKFDSIRRKVRVQNLHSLIKFANIKYENILFLFRSHKSLSTKDWEKISCPN